MAGYEATEGNSRAREQTGGRKDPWYRRRLVLLPVTAALAFLLGLVVTPVGQDGVPAAMADESAEGAGDTREDGAEALTARLEATEAERDEAVETLAEAEESARESATELERTERRLSHAQGRAEDLREELEAVEGLEAEIAALEAELEERAEAVEAVEEVAEQPEESDSGDATIGSTIMFDDWEITLADVREHGSLRNSSARGKFVVLVLDVTNHASTERDLLGGPRTGFNFADMPNDREFTFDSRASLDASRELDTDAWYLEDIGPGLSGRVPVAIDVTEDTAWGFAAMVKDGSISDPFFIDLESD